MAASQARYLGLTARKTNTEYEGQQVNQQRTALANQSAGLFNELMSLNVPTPPSTEEFTTVQYSFSDGFNTETMTNPTPLAGDPNYNYTVTHSHTQPTYTGINQVKTNPQVALTGGEYWINNLKTIPYVANTDGAAVAQIATDNPTSSVAAAYNGTGGHTTAELFSYKSGGITYYVAKADMDKSRIQTPAVPAVPAVPATVGPPPTPEVPAVPAVPQVDYSLTAQPSLPLYYAATLDKPISTTEKAYIQSDATGRMASITLESMPTTDFPLKTNTATDTNAYNDAMNQYTYDTNIYQKAVEDINAQTAIIQQEDRTLELRLKQLDTEQEALQTEMDAVKKVIDKNVETTFKTFA